MEKLNNKVLDQKEQTVKGDTMAQGVAFVMVSQVIFLINAYIMHVFLARFLGPATYGLWGVIYSLLVWVELILVAGIPNVVTKLFSEDVFSQKSVYKKSFRLQLSLSLVIFIVFFLAAPLIGVLLNDRSLVFYLEIAFIDIPFFGMLYLFYSFLRGNKLFKRLSIGTIIYTFAKTISIILLVLAGLSLLGALIGSILASIIALIYTLFVKKIGQITSARKQALSVDILKLVPPFITFSLTSQFITHIDLWSVKSILRDNTVTGYYNAASLLSQAPGFVLMAVSITLFPLLNSAISKNDIPLASRYLKQSIRLIAFIAFPLYSISVASSKSLITFIFSKAYLPAWSIFDILLIAFTFITFIEVISTLMLAVNDFKILTILMFTISGLALILNIILIPKYGYLGAAASTTISISFGIIYGIIYLKRKKMEIPLKSIIRISLASIIVFPLVKAFARDGFILIPVYMLAGLIYLLILLIIRELKKDDWLLVKEVIGRQKV